MIDPDLTQVLQAADKASLDILCDIITDKGAGRVSLDAGVRAQIVVARHRKSVDRAIVPLLVDEIQRFGGNTFVNLFARGGRGVAYREIVSDVAKRFGVPVDATLNVAETEMMIIEALVVRAFAKMSESEKERLFEEVLKEASAAERLRFLKDHGGEMTLAALQAAVALGGFAAYKLSLVAANAVARAVLGYGLSLGGNQLLAQAIKVFAGPIGWAVTIGWTAFDIANPAYRITIPCVVQVAYMRQEMLRRKRSGDKSARTKSNAGKQAGRKPRRKS